MDKIILKTDGVDVELKLEGDVNNLTGAIISAMNQNEDFAEIISTAYEIYWSEDYEDENEEDSL